MPWCDHCKKNTKTERGDDGYLCCTVCGRVIDQDVFSNEVTFYKGAGGQSHMSGTIVRSVESGLTESSERTLKKGRDEMENMVVSLNVAGGVIDEASRYYKIAVDRNFTRGRRTSLVAAACVYITCRENKKPYLLIDFSEYLGMNVYMLGAVFLQLCQLLRLEEHPVVQKPVDPSLFIHRFTERLLGGKNTEVSKTALRIIASMKRDWMQTGRRPSGLCGAALYISALSHGLRHSKADIVSVVHICEATLTKRLIEFENTESGSLTIEEFNMKADELEREGDSRQEPNLGTKSSGKIELLCEHKGTAKAHFAHGLCKACYDDFIILSGGLQGGSEPPAFQRAERDRMAKAATEEKAEESGLLEKELEPSSKDDRDVVENEKLESEPSQSIGATIGHQAVDDGASCQSQGNDDMDSVAGDESESLSDIDDVEVDGYLHNEEEKRYKKIIWEEMNKEYLEEQTAKEAAAAAAKEAYEVNFQNCSEELLAAQEFAAAAAAAVAKSRKEKKQKRDAEAKNATPAQTAAEATRQMLTKKRLSSKINYDVLDKLFDDSMDSENPKKKLIESDANDHPTKVKIKGNEEEPESDLVDDDDNTLQEDEYGEEGYGEETYGYGDDSYYGNEEEEYGYDEDYGYNE
ncbi:Transcription factor TFIIB [Macleaya cordata]|uniref:Transcription factor TFIIB n=1 Tax=Macleaya cordata TaxID=56857 RepID=A0A200QLF4_MACCD|nr:Transcription factor TFIIB [Macleaya cordata]